MSKRGRNEVRGRRGWSYGIMVTGRDGSATFDLVGPDGRTMLKDLRASRCRTTTLARKTGSSLKGYEQVAREAIDALRSIAREVE